MESINPNRYLLLTGAGFTANWGGYLSSEVWGAFYSHPEIRKHPRVMDRFKHESSFEVALASSYLLDFSPEESKSVQKAILDTFQLMDTVVSDIDNLNHTNIDHHGFTSRLLARMCATHQDKNRQSFLFTLNQDILLERIWFRDNMHQRVPPNMPGVPPCRLTRCGNRSSNLGYFGPGLPRFQSDYMDVTDPLVSPISESFERSLHPTNYIKLHGSFNWWRESNDLEVVIGSEKSRQIHDSPLLAWYASIYESVLQCSGLRMMVIGYSFQDRHINTPIFNAVLEGRLDLFVWDTGFDRIRRSLIGQDEFLPGIESKEQGARVLGAMQSSAFPISRIVPREGSKAEFDRILEQYFV